MKSSIVLGGMACIAHCHAFLIPSAQTTSVPMTSRQFPSVLRMTSKEDEAKALLEKVKKMREEIASLEGRSVSEVEEEAAEKTRLKQRRQQEEAAQRLERKKAPKIQSTNGSFLNVPERFDDQVEQAADSVRRAYKDGVTRQVVRFALFPEDEMLNEKERLWPGGAQQMYREAAGPLTRSMMKLVGTSDAFQKCNVTTQDVWDFDGSALVTAESAEGPEGDSQALVFPNTDNKYTKDIAEIDKAMGDRLFILVNPFWRDIETWGFNLLAPKAKEMAQKAIFDRDFQETYVLLEKSVRGESCIALKAYPYDWQLYAYAEMDYWPYDETIIYLGSTKEEPTLKDFGDMMSKHEEFKMSKNMRQMQRVMNRNDD